MAKGVNEDEPCPCSRDIWKYLPPELRPKPDSPLKGLREATCPGCGKTFLTNRDTDYCFDCERQLE